MLTTPPTRTSFSGHESFALRYSWLPKAVQGLPEQPDLFLLEDATTLLGVGKNMVSSIRHWCTVMGLIQPMRGQKGHFQPTELATLLLSEKGWDPYLEDPGTLWLLHHLILQNPEEATLWHLLFTVFRTDTFTRQEVVSWVMDLLQHQGGSRANVNSIERDFEVLIRTYLPALTPKGHVGEESFDSPLVELGLLKRVDRNTFSFVRGEHRSLPDAIFAYALVDHWQKHFMEVSTVNLERFMYHPGAPGAAFKLTETAFLNRVDQVHLLTGIHFDDTAGMRSLIRSADWTPTTLQNLLRHHYAEERQQA